MNIRTAMLTGDSEQSAAAVAKETGIDTVFSKLLPGDKLNILKELRKEHGNAMFVGDGINDAPVLAGADVGAAMGSGADAAIEAADVVFMTSSMEAIPASIRIAKKTGAIALHKDPCNAARSFRLCLHVDGCFCRFRCCHALRIEFHPDSLRKAVTPLLLPHKI